MTKTITIILVVSAILITGVFFAGCTQDAGTTTQSTPVTQEQVKAAAQSSAGNVKPSGTPSGDMQMNSTAMSGTPPEGMAMNGTHPSGTPPEGMGNMTKPSGTPPGDMPGGEGQGGPSGTPPSGTPPSGTPPTS